jgi:hypothetical protein
VTQPGRRDRSLDRSVDELDQDTLRWALDAARFVRNPVFTGVVFAGLLVLAGGVILAISAWGVSRQDYVALQVPYLISGGCAALGLIITGACVSSILGSRRDAAMADEELNGVLADLTDVTRLAIRRRAGAGARE